MRYRKLGRSGLLVSELCLGTNTFGGTGPMWASLGALTQPDVDAVLKTAIDGGINFLDTADIYGSSDSEERVGQALRNLGILRPDVVIATKVGGRTGKGPNAIGSSRLHLLEAAHASLRRLHTDYIDVYMLHFPDPATPLEETLRALDDLVTQGKVRYVGCSNFHAWQVAKAIGLSERHGLACFQAIETHWSVATRDAERELVPMAIDSGLGIMVWGPLLGGLLTGKYGRNDTQPVSGRAAGKVPATVDRERLFDTVDALRSLVPRVDATVAQLALAWLLHKPGVSSVLVGARNSEQVRDNLRTVDVRLAQEDMQLLDALAPPVPLHDGVTQVAQALAERLEY